MQEDNERTVLRPTDGTEVRLPETTSTPAAGSNALAVGTRLNDFEIAGVIAETDFDILYRAYDHAGRRTVALKEYLPSVLASRAQEMYISVISRQHSDTYAIGLKSFLNEARVLSRFDSPSLVKVYHFWEGNGTAYVAMPYYEGITLEQAMAERRITPDDRWIRTLLDSLLKAVDALHQAGYYHRNIAPGSIFLRQAGSPLLLGFGAAERVIRDLAQGKKAALRPGFAAIEQYGVDPAFEQGAWTDFYALGAVAYYLIAGKAPPPATDRAIKDKMLPARAAGHGRYSDALLQSVDKALAVRPEHRIRSATELWQALAPVQDQDAASRMPDHQPAPGSSSAGFTQAPRRPAGRPRPYPRPQASPVHGPTLHDGNEAQWQSMVADRRPLPPPRHAGRRALGTLGLLLAGACAGIGGYFWMNPEAFPPQLAAAIFGPAPSIEARSPLPAESAPMSEGDGQNISRTAASPAQPMTPASGDDGRATPVGTEATAAAQPPAEPAPTQQAAVRVQQPATPPPASQSEVGAPAPAAPAMAAEDKIWKAAIGKDTREGYQAYLHQYPHGKHVASAQMYLDRLQPPGVQPPYPSTSRPEAPATRKAEEAQPSEEHDAVRSSAAAGSESGQGPATAQPTPSQPARAAIPTPTAPPENTATTTATTEPREPEVITDSPAAPAPVSISADAPVMKLRGQTLTGRFRQDPVTGLISGTGRIRWNNGDVFEGTLVNGVKEGKGRFIWASGQQYDGDWSRDQPNGKGVLRFANGNRYEGDVRNGEPDGQGTTRFRNGDAYTGTWVKGIPEGSGQFIWANGNRYQGEVSGGQPNGQGTTRFRSGDVYTGGWLNGKHDGHGRYTWKSGDYWEGEFRDGAKTDNGKLVYAERAPAAAPPPVAENGGASEPRVAGSSGQ